MRLHHVAMVCTSLENADLFCGEILGLEKIKTFTLPEDLADQIFEIAATCDMITYGDENLTIEVFLVGKTPDQQKGFGHFCLEVENRDDFLNKCEFAVN